MRAYDLQGASDIKFSHLFVASSATLSFIYCIAPCRMPCLCTFCVCIECGHFFSVSKGETSGEAKKNKVTAPSSSNGSLPQSGLKPKSHLPYNLYLKPLCIQVNKDVKLKSGKKIVGGLI